MKKILLAVACCAMTLLAQANPTHKVKINDGLTVSVEACSESIFRIKVSPRNLTLAMIHPTCLHLCTKLLSKARKGDAIHPEKSALFTIY